MQRLVMLLKFLTKKEFLSCRLWAKVLLKVSLRKRPPKKPVFQGAYNLDDSISLATSSKFTMIDCNQLLSDVTDKLIKKDIVLVTENDKLCNVLTDIDILHFINDKESN